MAKRGNGEGTVRQRPDGLWEARITLPDGRRKSAYAKTRKEASAKLTATLRDLQRGVPVLTTSPTLGRYLDTWLAGIQGSVKVRTHERYATLLRLHVRPTLGTLALPKLQPADLRTLYADKQASGLSAATVQRVHAVLHTALAQAERDGLIARNVASLVQAPRVAQHTMHTLSPEQARALLSAAHGERLEALYVLALNTGMREGELLALTWADVDLEHARLQVRGSLQRSKAHGLAVETPKTTGSRRNITLSATAVAALRKHRAAQHEERLKLGSIWIDNNLVFTSEIGTFVHASNMLRRSFWPLLARADLPRIRFHDLRHTAATLLLGQGIHPKIVSEMLGHTKIGITLDLYSHVSPTMQSQATAALDAVFAG